MSTKYYEVFGDDKNPLYINGEKYILGSKTAKIDLYNSQTTWTGESLDNRFSFHLNWVEYHGKIHWLGLGKHYIYNGTTLEESTEMFPVYHNTKTNEDITYDVSNPTLIIYNDEIHMMGGTLMGAERKEFYKYHYKWKEGDTEWTQVSTLPYNVERSSVAIYNNEIHLMGGIYSGTNKYHYIYNGTSWKKSTAVPYPIYGCHNAMGFKQSNGYDRLSIICEYVSKISGTSPAQYRKEHVCADWDVSQSNKWDYQLSSSVNIGSIIEYNSDLKIVSSLKLEGTMIYALFDGNVYISDNTYGHFLFKKLLTLPEKTSGLRFELYDYIGYLKDDNLTYIDIYNKKQYTIEQLYTLIIEE